MITILVLQLHQRKRPRTQTLLNIPVLNTTTLHEQLLRTFISLNLSFRAIENQPFQTLIQMLNPEAATQLPGRTKFRELLNRAYDATLKDLLTD